MLLQHLKGGKLGQFYGEPSPREIHLLYLQGFRLGSEAYAGQVLDMYQANGRVASVAVAAMSNVRLNLLNSILRLCKMGQ